MTKLTAKVKQELKAKATYSLSGLGVLSLVVMTLLAACGDVASPTAQPGSVATATVNVPTATTTSVPATTSAPTPTVDLPTITPAPATTAIPTPTVAATTADIPTTVVTTTSVAATTEATTTTVATKAAPTSLPQTAPTAAPAKGTGNQTHIFADKDNNGTVQLNTGDTLLAQLNPDLDWTFEVVGPSGVLAGPAPATKPYENSFKAVGVGKVQINAQGRCRPVPGQVCFKAIIANHINVTVH